jgi:hypothetical protein
MVRKLLRLFSYVRELEANVVRVREANQEQFQEKLRLQDRLDAAIADRKALWDMTQECLRGERVAYQMHVNQSWQRQGGGVPYPDAPHLPANTNREPRTEPAGRKGRMLPSEAVAQSTSQFITSMYGQG